MASVDQPRGLADLVADRAALAAAALREIHRSRPRFSQRARPRSYPVRAVPDKPDLPARSPASRYRTSAIQLRVRRAKRDPKSSSSNETGAGPRSERGTSLKVLTLT